MYTVKIAENTEIFRCKLSVLGRVFVSNNISRHCQIHSFLFHTDNGSSYFCTLIFFFTASEWKIVFGLFTKMLLIPQIVSLFESNLGRHLCPLLITQTEIMLDSQREEKSKTKQKRLLETTVVPSNALRPLLCFV